MGVDAGTVFASVRLDLNSLQRDVQGVRNQFQTLNTNAATQSKKFQTQWTNSINAISIASAAAFAGIIKIGQELIKTASDAQETWSKFRTVFNGIEEDAQAAAEGLVNSFGQSGQAAAKLLGDVGDILIGFGFARDEALELATATAELGIDLASFTNFAGGASGATQALTKALLGEAESVKALGIVIRQDTAEYKDLVESIQLTEGATLLQAKALAALQIATRQSQNAIGDFARTEDSFANQSRILQARIEDLKNELGQELLPIATEVIGVFRGVVESFAGLDDRVQKTIVQIGGITAAAVALAPAIQASTLAFGALKLILGGPVGLVALAGAGAIALFNLAEAAAAVKREADFEVLSEESKQIAGDIGATAVEFDQVIDRIGTAFTGLSDVREVITQTEAVSQALGISFERTAELVLETVNINQHFLDALKEELERRRQLNTEYVSQSEAIALAASNYQKLLDIIVAERESALAAQAEEDRLLEKAEQRYRRRQEREAQYAETIAERLRLQEEAEAALAAEQAAALAAALAAEDRAFEKSEQRFRRRQEREDQYAQTIAERSQLQEDAETALAENEAATAAAREQQAADERQRLADLANYETQLALDQLEQEKKDHQERLRMIQQLTSLFGAQFGALFSAFDKIAEASADAELQRLQVQIDSFERGTEERVALEEEFDRRSKELEREAAQRQKALAIFNATISTASAIIGFLANPGGIPGIVLSALAGVTGAAQIAAIAAQPLPTLASGGIALPTGPARGSAVIAAENGSPELLLNAGTQGEALLQGFADKIAEQIGAAGAARIEVPLVVDGVEMARSVVDYVNRRVTPVNGSSVIAGQ